MILVNKIYSEWSFGYVFFMVMGLIGSFGRIYCWAHYFFDVIGGLILSVIFNEFAKFLFDKYEQDIFMVYIIALISSAAGLFTLSHIYDLEKMEKV